jgi:hypothetical protein
MWGVVSSNEDELQLTNTHHHSVGSLESKLAIAWFLKGFPTFMGSFDLDNDFGLDDKVARLKRGNCGEAKSRRVREKRESLFKLSAFPHTNYEPILVSQDLAQPDIQ